MHPPAAPRDLRGRLRPLTRWEWRRGDGGDPLQLLRDFLADSGLPVHDLAAPPAPTGAGMSGPPVVGAALLVGGSVGAADVDAAWTPAPSPCPRVPDVAAVVFAAGPAAAVAAEDGLAVAEWRQSWTPGQHAAAVATVRDAIARGDLYQANLVGHQAAGCASHPQAVDNALRAVPGTPYAGSLAGPGWSVHSVSPERLVAVRAGLAETRPIKGTWPRGQTADADAAAAAALAGSAKDRAEHVMIVDLERNDLARVAVTGGVRVTELYAVRPLAGLWHAESTVTATLAAGVDLATLLAALLPGGSVTGAPKLAALAEIGRLEPVGRGPAMGALGWLGADATLDLGLSIRTLALADGQLHLWAGGGVTWGSEPAAEVAEAAAKAAPLLAALTRTTGQGAQMPR